MVQCDSSFALKLQTLETVHSEGTETEGNSGRRDLFSETLFPANRFKNMFSGTQILCLLAGEKNCLIA